MITLVNLWRDGVPKRFLIEVNAAWSAHATTEADSGGRPGSGLWDLPAWTTRYRHLLQSCTGCTFLLATFVLKLASSFWMAQQMRSLSGERCREKQRSQIMQ